MSEVATRYPATLSVDYPERLDRLTTFFRLFTVIPIAIVLGLLTGSSHSLGGQPAAYIGAGGILFLPVLLMLVFRRKYPRWWFDWNLAVTRFSYRVTVYFLLLTDKYPSTDEEQSVHVDLPYPDATALNRWLPLVKWLLAIPHFIVVIILGIAALIVTVIAWFAILFTGVYPRGMFDFVVGVMRWGLRVSAYAALLTTDQYPPFSLSA